MNFAMKIKCFTSTPPVLVNKLMDATRYRYNEDQGIGTMKISLQQHWGYFKNCWAYLKH